MTIAEFEREIFNAAVDSKICEVPIIRRLTSSAINIRLQLIIGGFIDAFYNEQTKTTSFTLINQEQRIYGADNTGGWHIHPFDDPAKHIPTQKAVNFTEFLIIIENQFIQNESSDVAP